jgi:hypothetical protein
MYEPVQITIMDRTCTTDVAESAEGTPVLVGQLVLGSLDLVVDLQSRSLIGNPARGREHICEMY